MATDGSKESAPAGRTAGELANGTGSELHVVHALSTAPKPPSPAIGKGSEATFLETEKESRHSHYWRKS